MIADMTYSGKLLIWGILGFKATSGLPGHQTADEQGHMDHGPIPEGLYWFPLFLGQDATMTSEKGDLDGRQGIEHLPDQWQYHGQVYRNQAWGPDRVRLNIIKIDNPKNRKRGGFYLHDSTKGYTHGCIETQPSFFQILRDYVATPLAKRERKKRLILRVKYPSATASTYGETDK